MPELYSVALMAFLIGLVVGLWLSFAVALWRIAKLSRRLLDAVTALETRRGKMAPWR